MMRARHAWLLLPAFALVSCATPPQRPLGLDRRDYSIAASSHVFHGGRPLIRVSQGEREFPALADTGATRSLVAVPDAVHRAAANKAGTEWIGAQNDPLEGVPVTIWINATPHPGFAIAESKATWSGQFPMILGLDVLRTHRVVFDYENRSTRWGEPPSSRRPIQGVPSLFVLPAADDGEWIILDSGAVNSYYLTSREPVDWDAKHLNRGGFTLRLMPASMISRHILMKTRRVGVLGAVQQMRQIRSFSTSDGVMLISG